jgi:hypothetical protein
MYVDRIRTYYKMLQPNLDALASELVRDGSKADVSLKKQGVETGGWRR